MRALLAISLLIAGGCRTRPLDAPAPDGGGDMQPNSCLTHTRQPVPLVALDALSSASAGMGQSVRALATVALRPCDVLADFTVDVQPGDATDFVTVTAHAWVGSRDCGAAVRVARALELEPAGANPNVSVRDGAPGGAIMLHLSLRAASPDQPCDRRPELAPCDRTCQCQAADPTLHCLLATGGARCGRPCREDVECDQTCESRSPDGVPFVCGPPTATCCAQTCGFAQVCDRATCACVVSSTPTSTPCRCDADCAAGTLCSDGGRCFNPCSVLADCPKPEAAACDRGICSFFVQ